MNTPRTDKEVVDMGELFTRHAADFARQLERELAESKAYADKLANGLPVGMLPKDIDNLREANAGLSAELTEVSTQATSDRADMRTLAGEVKRLTDELGRLQQQVKKPRASDADEISELKAKLGNARNLDEQWIARESELMAKLEKCRTALEIISQGQTDDHREIAREALEQTK